ncbi:glucosaminidase domain-containing protein [Paenibacillus glucanolyticus]|uniref:Mannosyl-glycoprotein endo-beta-N-acetylglucosamidase-like domain-containing protein n=1 Tax=Paenibacillus glucanolyticus TaxID=59843 RepID=A0A163KAR8_9BACL|nr:glucosaminidase domain-containing protein [Paenibacillus glucanolyticus]KZS47104.1 hypothetical protein AWU65_14800 [Paenibacillus glucanolyticus]
MACAANISNTVNGAITYNGTRYDILALAEWVSYQSWRKSGGLNGMPVAMIITQWGFEHGWGATGLADIQATLNFAFQRSACGYSGTYDNSRPSGRNLIFSTLRDGISAYAKLMIEGYIHVRYAYSRAGGNAPGIRAAVKALQDGYDPNYTGPASGFCHSQVFALNSYATRRIWAEHPYPGMDTTITNSNNTCLNSLMYIQKTDPNVYGLPNLY